MSKQQYRSLFAFAAFVLALLFLPRTASAYPWMIRNDYTSCATCHVDPSGAGLMTQYGRAQSEVLLRTHWSKTDGEDPSKGGFMFGLVPLPEKGPLFQFDQRSAYLYTKAPSAPALKKVILMQTDAAAGIQTDHLRASGSLGYTHEGALAASVTHGTEDRLVSRQHWIGVAFGEDEAFLLRGGRMNVPFGIRNIEHTLAARRLTKSDGNDAQQHGVAFSYNGGPIRADVMAIFGNFQLSPDELRERGYAGYFELAASSSAAAGVSSAVLHVDYDLDTSKPTFWQAHGLFARYAPVKPVVLMAEADMLARSPKGHDTEAGYVGFVQADVEPVQGVHLAATGEAWSSPGDSWKSSYGAWGSVFWFFLPHLDIRADAVWNNVVAGSSRSDVVTILGQIHGFL